MEVSSASGHHQTVMLASDVDKLRKVFYKIGEVSEMTGLPASVLRFWESEFTFLKPKKTRGRHRVYQSRDIEIVLEIKRMLYDEGYTIAGVKRYWFRRNRTPRELASGRARTKRVKDELRAILGMLKPYEKEREGVRGNR